MTTRAAFLADISENIDDDTPRLVFADWLEEYGGQSDQAGAEFIRLQCRQARLPPQDPEIPLLERRATELLALHEDTWRDELPELDGVEWGTQFSRGFVEEIRIAHHRAFKLHSARVFAATPVRRLAVKALTASQTQALGRAPSVRHLSELRIANAGDEAGDVLSAIASAPHLESLATLHLVGRRNSHGDGLNLLAERPASARLRHLHLERIALTADNARILTGSPHLAGLVSLGLCRCEGAGAGVPVLARLASWSGLTELDLSGVPLNHVRVAPFATAAILGGLRVLRLSGCGGGPVLAWVLADATQARSLEFLDLENNRLGPVGARHLAAAPHLCSLRELNLAGNHLGPEGVRSLAAASHLSGLTRLDLRRNNFTRGGVALADSPHLQGLKQLHLDAPMTGIPIDPRLQQWLGARLCVASGNTFEDTDFEEEDPDFDEMDF